jgi:hypothetical protein
MNYKYFFIAFILVDLMMISCQQEDPLPTSSFFSDDHCEQAFPKLLREAGYQTAIIGKWHMKSVPRGYSF